jgi:thiol-disulfide isomerase/thioredoxin
MMKIYILLGVSIIILILLRTYVNARRSGALEGFNSSDKQLIIVKAKWCGHCKTAMPEFERAVAESPVSLKDDSTVTIRMLDEADNRDEVTKLGVTGFPTIIYMDGNKRMEYSGERTYDGIMGFIQAL